MPLVILQPESLRALVGKPRQGCTKVISTLTVLATPWLSSTSHGRCSLRPAKWLDRRESHRRDQSGKSCQRRLSLGLEG